MKEPKIIVKDVYKPVSEAERHKTLTKSILKVIKIEQDKKILASSDEVSCNHSYHGL